MMGVPKTNAPKSKIVSQSPELSSITANTAITIERPIKRPATQLPAFRHLTRGLFIFTLILTIMAGSLKVVDVLAHLQRNKVAQRLADRVTRPKIPSASCYCSVPTALSLAA
jgi:hypothetical protein